MEDKKKNKIVLIVLILSIMLMSFPRIFEYKDMVTDIYMDTKSNGNVIFDYRFYYFAFKTVWEGREVDKLHDCIFLQEMLSGGNGENYFKESYPYGCYLYPAHFAVLFSWLAQYPYWESQIIWTVISTLLFIVGIALFAKLMFSQFGEVHKKYRYLFTFIMIWVGLLIVPTTVDTYWVNSNRLIFFLISLVFYLHYHLKETTWAGFILGLSIVFKITPAILLVFYLYKKQWKIFYGVLISGVITTAITIKYVGFKTVYKFATHDFFYYSKGLSNQHEPPVNSSIKGIVSKYMPELNSSIVFLIYVAIILGIYLYALYKNENTEKEIILFSLSPLLFTPHLETNHMIMALFGIFILFHYLFVSYEKIDKKFNWTFVMLVISSYYLLAHPKSIEFFIVCLFIFVSTLINFKKQKTLV